jgi:hypothetical protein
MAEKPSDLVQGTLDMLILKTLALEPMHGYGIAVGAARDWLPTTSAGVHERCWCFRRWRSPSSW